MRYQRHVENFHQQHVKEVIEELAKLVRDEQIKEIILAGDETVIIPLLRGETSKELEEKIVGVLPLSVDTPEHEVLEASEKAIRQHDTLQDQEKIEHLFEENYDDGLGVTGVEKTLTALSNGQVQERLRHGDHGVGQPVGPAHVSHLGRKLVRLRRRRRCLRECRRGQSCKRKSEKNGAHGTSPEGQKQ